MVVNPVQSQWTSIQFLLFCTLPKKSGKKSTLWKTGDLCTTQYKKTPYLYRLFQFIYLRVPGVASNIMRNRLFQFTGILLTSNVFKLFTHESMVGFLHVKVSYPTTHLINSHMLYRIQNLLFFSKSKINCLWSKGLDSRFTKSRQIQWYTFIHLYIQSRNLQTYWLQQQATQASLIQSLK